MINTRSLLVFIVILGLFVATVVGMTEWKKNELSESSKIPELPTSQINPEYFDRKPTWSVPVSKNFVFTPPGQTDSITVPGTSVCQVYTYERVGSGPEKKPELKTMFTDYLEGYSHRYSSKGVGCIDPDQIAGVNETKDCLESYNKCLNSSGREFSSGSGVSYPISCITDLCSGKVGSISLNFRKDDNSLMTPDTMCLSIDEIKMSNKTYDDNEDRLEFYKNIGIVSLDSSLKDGDPLPIRFSNQVCNPLDPKQKLKIDRYSNSTTESSSGNLLKISFRALPDYYLDMDFTQDSIQTFSVVSGGTSYVTGVYNITNNTSGDDATIYVDNDNAITPTSETIRQDNFTIIDGGTLFVPGNNYSVTTSSSSAMEATIRVEKINRGDAKLVMRKKTDSTDTGNKWLYIPSLDLSPLAQRIPAEQRVSYVKFVPIAAKVTAEQLEPPKSTTEQLEQDVGSFIYNLANEPGDSLERKAAQINANRSYKMIPSKPVKLGDRVTPSVFNLNSNAPGDFPKIVSQPSSYPDFVMNATVVNGSGNVTPYNYVNYNVSPSSENSQTVYRFSESNTTKKIGDLDTELDIDVDWNLTDPFSGIITFPENYYTDTSGAVLRISPASGNQNIRIKTSYMSPFPNTLVTGSALRMTSNFNLGVKTPPTSSLQDVPVTVKGSGEDAKFSLIYSEDFYLVPTEGGKNFEVGDILSLDPNDIDNLGGLVFSNIPTGSELTYTLVSTDIDANKVVKFKSMDDRNLILTGSIVSEPDIGLVFRDVSGVGLPEIETPGLGFSASETVNIINVDKKDDLTTPDASIVVVNVTTSEYLVRDPAPVSIGSDVNMEYNFMSNSPMVLDPTPAQLVYAGAISTNQDSLIKILTDANVDINSQESITRYLSDSSIDGKTEITFLKSLQFSSINYSTTDKRSPETQEQPLLGKYIPHSLMTSVTGSGSGLKWKEGDTYYNSNNFQFVNYGLVDPYKRTFSNSSNL